MVLQKEQWGMKMYEGLFLMGFGAVIQSASLFSLNGLILNIVLFIGLVFIVSGLGLGFKEMKGFNSA